MKYFDVQKISKIRTVLAFTRSICDNFTLRSLSVAKMCCFVYILAVIYTLI